MLAMRSPWLSKIACYNILKYTVKAFLKCSLQEFKFSTFLIHTNNKDYK